jgi:DNA-binding XRE family transcriptional regulator
MPFVQINVDEIIKQKCKEDDSFKTAWEESRAEYRLIGEMIELRKAKKITQSQLATITGNKQQVISRIERKESTPTLKTFCNLLDAIGYELKIVKKKSV